jgi:isoquinoline 1-oxidoreductase
LTRTIPAKIAVTPSAEWKIAGAPLPKINARDIATGAHKYTSDMKAPGMLYAKVLHRPSFGATLVSLDSTAAEATPGVTVVHDGDFVGVTAPDAPTAESAAAALRADWKPLVAGASSKDVYAYFKKNSREPAETTGLTAYTVAHTAHVPLEPRPALARWDGRAPAGIPSTSPGCGEAAEERRGAPTSSGRWRARGPAAALATRLARLVRFRKPVFANGHLQA